MRPSILTSHRLHCLSLSRGSRILWYRIMTCPRVVLCMQRTPTRSRSPRCLRRRIWWRLRRFRVGGIWWVPSSTHQVSCLLWELGGGRRWQCRMSSWISSCRREGEVVVGRVRVWMVIGFLGASATPSRPCPAPAARISVNCLRGSRCWPTWNQSCLRTLLGRQASLIWRRKSNRSLKCLAAPRAPSIVVLMALSAASNRLSTDLSPSWAHLWIQSTWILAASLQAIRAWQWPRGSPG